LPPKPHRGRIRAAVVGSGALLILGCAVASFLFGSLLWDAWPEGHESGRLPFVVPFAPLAAAAVLITSVIWTRRLGPSTLEGMLALLCVQLINWGIVRYFAGEWWSFFVFVWWALSSLIYAPWWLLGFAVGGGFRRIGDLSPSVADVGLSN